MRRGTIKLLGKDGEVLSQLVYMNAPIRKIIMERWKKLYGIRYYQCMIQIVPQVNAHKVKKDGTNGLDKYRTNFVDID